MTPAQLPASESPVSLEVTDLNLPLADAEADHRRLDVVEPDVAEPDVRDRPLKDLRLAREQ